MKAAVVGGGTMGNGIAHAFAQSGFDVILIDISKDVLDKALATITRNMDRQIKKGGLDEAARDAALTRIQTDQDISGASAADIVIEAVPGNAQLKEKIFRTLDAECPAGVILASNTSSISITQLAGYTKRPQQVIGMHFMNPVPVMQLIEVVRGLATSRSRDRKPTGCRAYPGCRPPFV